MTSNEQNGVYEKKHTFISGSYSHYQFYHCLEYFNRLIVTISGVLMFLYNYVMELLLTSWSLWRAFISRTNTFGVKISWLLYASKELYFYKKTRLKLVLGDNIILGLRINSCSSYFDFPNQRCKSNRQLELYYSIIGTGDVCIRTKSITYFFFVCSWKCSRWYSINGVGFVASMCMPACS